MKLTIHRGTKEIGGNCVELCSQKTRIIIDLGMPLVNAQNEPFDSKLIDSLSVSELLDNNVLPRVRGLYAGEGRGVDAVIISQSHQDHYGLLRYLNPEIPVYLSKGAKALIEASDIFIPMKANLRNAITFKMWEPFLIGGLVITPKLVDHSCFDATAFLINGENKKIFYSGDFRGHGRKGILLENAIKQPEVDVDYLLLEGSMLGRGDCLYPSERAVEDKMVSMFRGMNNISFVFCSSQNIDRLVSIYRAAKRSGKITVIDIYTAYILNSLKDISQRLPQYWMEDVKVLFLPHHEEALARSGLEILMDELLDHEIRIVDMNRNKKNIVMITKDNSFFTKILNAIDEYNGVQAIYSLWEGYLEDSKLPGMLKKKGITLEKIHTSGHAPEQDLRRLVEAFKPKCIVPIHTFHPQDYQLLFPDTKVLILRDGEELTL